MISIQRRDDSIPDRDRQTIRSTDHMKQKIKKTISILLVLVICVMPSACGSGPDDGGEGLRLMQKACGDIARKVKDEKRNSAYREKTQGGQKPAADLSLRTDFYDDFDHGDKSAKFQKYIVLHDTEGSGDADTVISGWLNDGKYIASHFIVNKDGTIVQCVPLDRIAHHAGFGDTGHNEKYGVSDESRDDKVGTVGIGNWARDYGMNSHSIGIEIVHVGGSSGYPEAQLNALDNLIAYIDAYYGNKSEIIDHKTWRLYNSDCSKEFDQYMENYGKTRTHDGSKA